jgi:hypothetical protein
LAMFEYSPLRFLDGSMCMAVRKTMPEGQHEPRNTPWFT